MTETSKTLIDVNFTSNPAITVDSGIVETRISDHYLVFAVLNLRVPKPPAAYVVPRSYKYYNPQGFLSDLNKISWYENILSDDVNEKLLHFNKAFFRVLDNHAPIKKMKIKQRRCPFINVEIKGIAYQLRRSRAQLILGIRKNLRRNLMSSLRRWEYVPQRKPKDSHQSMVFLLHIKNSLSVLYPKKMSFNFELLPLSRSIGLYSHFLEIKRQGKIKYKWQW